MEAEPHLGVLVCPCVFDGSLPVLVVASQSGGFQLLCGADHDRHAGRPRVVGVGHLLERDPSLRDLLNLPVGWYAEREDAHSPWHRARIEP